MIYIKFSCVSYAYMCCSITPLAIRGIQWVSRIQCSPQNVSPHRCPTPPGHIPRYAKPPTVSPPLLIRMTTVSPPVFLEKQVRSHFGFPEGGDTVVIGIGGYILSRTSRFANLGGDTVVIGIQLFFGPDPAQRGIGGYSATGIWPYR